MGIEGFKRTPLGDYQDSVVAKATTPESRVLGRNKNQERIEIEIDKIKITVVPQDDSSFNVYLEDMMFSVSQTSQGLRAVEGGSRSNDSEYVQRLLPLAVKVVEENYFYI